MGLVNGALVRAFKINKKLPMSFIFDHVSPARRFKRGMPFDEAGSFPDCTREEMADATDTDDIDEVTGRGLLMPFDPKPYM